MKPHEIALRGLYKRLDEIVIELGIRMQDHPSGTILYPLFEQAQKDAKNARACIMIACELDKQERVDRSTENGR